MTTLRRQHSGEFKAKVVLEALRGERTLNEIAADYGVHPLQITQWKKVALEGLPTRLSSRRGTKHKEEEALTAALVPADRAVKGRAGLAEKKSGPSPLRKRAGSWSRGIPSSASVGNAPCWG